MIPRILPGMLLAASLMTFSTGCYDRWTGNYSELKELDGKNEAVLERAELTPEEREKRRNILVEASKMKKTVDFLQLITSLFPEKLAQKLIILIM